MSGNSQNSDYYAERSFEGFTQKGRLYLGPGFFVGMGIIVFSFGMSCACSKSCPNLASKWLQRRSGAQIGTFAHFVTTSCLFEHDGDKWVARDWSHIKRDFLARFDKKPTIDR